MDILKIIKALLLIVSKEEINSPFGKALEAVLFEFTTAGELILTATNGHILATVTVEYNCASDKNFIIHQSVLKKVITGIKNDLTMSSYDKQLYFMNDVTCIADDGLSDMFPDYRNILKKKSIYDGPSIIDNKYLLIAANFFKILGYTKITVEIQGDSQPMLLTCESAKMIIMPIGRQC